MDTIVTLLEQDPRFIPHFTDVQAVLTAIFKLPEDGDKEAVMVDLQRINSSKKDREEQQAVF